MHGQQVHYPYNPLQLGPMNFLTPRKCAIFGVCSEGVPRQVSFTVSNVQQFPPNDAFL